MKKREEEKKPVLPDYVREAYGFQYRISYDEAYETFSLLSVKWSRKTQMVLAALLSLIAAGMLIMYFLDSRRANYFVIAILSILMLFYLLYLPVLKARKGAAKVAKQAGQYKVQITARGEILLPQADAIDLAGDKDARAVETEKVFAIRTDRLNTFCLPKRIMNPKEIQGIREILKAYMKFETREG